MIKIKEKYKAKYNIIILLILLFFISVITLYSVCTYFNQFDILKKQIIWYLIGFILIFLLSKMDCKKIINHSFILYFFINIILLLLLFISPNINGSKCWLIIPGIGSVQPSEFAKIILILFNTKMFEILSKKYPKRNTLCDIKITFIIIMFTLILGVLTFLEPDTGMVIIYFLISFVMLFMYGIKKRIFFSIFFFTFVIVTIFLYFYFNYQDSFINIFGTSFFYRINRLLDWSNKDGMQLNNAMVAIKAAGLFGFGIGKTPIYIPEAHTDFIFSVFSSNFGFVGTIILITILFLFDYNLFKLLKNTTVKNCKFIIVGFLSMIVYQQIQNIAMNIGLLPITGITLPFVSYGGSSLISYFLCISIILNYDYDKKIKPLIK